MVTNRQAYPSGAGMLVKKLLCNIYHTHLPGIAASFRCAVVNGNQCTHSATQ